MRKYFFLCLVLFSAFSYAQNPQPSVKKVLPPSPEASACFKFIEEPVSAYTGLLNTSVPIFNIQLKEINIPVTINYHSRGVRVDEIASRVGIGWSLEYGGMVTRAIRGVADDGLYGIKNDYLYPGAFNNNTTRAALFSRFINDTHCDEISDVYSYSNSHSSGKFFFDHFDKKFVLQQYADVKVEPVYEQNNTAIAGWIITDDKGTRYYYGLSENKLRTANDVDYVTKSHIYDATCGTSQQNPEFDVRDINTWHLMEVRTVFNEKVEFFYQLETSYYFRKNADEVHNVFDPQDPKPSHVRTNISEMVSHQYQVAEIRFPGGKVVFTQDNLGRGDLKGAHALDSVKIVNEHAELTKSFRFSYFYTKDNNTSNVLPYLKNIDTSAARRMFLGQVQERGSSGLAQPPYIFEYHVQNPLPNRFSTSQDAWGYYNGANNGYYSIIQNLGTLQNVTVDTVKSELGLLKKISYPTGGYTSFTYEHNRAVLPEQFYNAFYNNPNPVTLEDKSAGMAKFPFHYDSASNTYKQAITIGARKVGNVRSSVTFSPSDGCSETEDIPYCPWQIFLFGNPYSFKLLKGVHDMVIPPGNYTLEVVPSGSIDLSDFRNTFNVVLSWQEEKAQTDSTGPKIIFASGKRIKKVEYQAPGVGSTTTEYKYTDQNGATSGRIFGFPEYFDIRNYYGDWPVIAGINGSPYAGYRNNSIGYARVEELIGMEGNTAGKNIYEYTTFEDGGNAFFKYPFHTPIDNEWLRGKLLSLDQYEWKASGFTLRSSARNKYLFSGVGDGGFNLFYGPPPFQHADSVNTHSYIYSKERKIFYLPYIQFIPDDEFVIDGSKYRTYYLTGGTLDLASSEQATYGNDGAKLESSTIHYYDYDKNYQLKGTVFVNSTGDSVIQHNAYPDTLSSVPEEQQLARANRYSNLLSVEKKIKHLNNTVKDLEVLSYKYKQFNPSILATEKVLAATNGLPQEDRVYFLRYDSLGNIQEQQKTSDVKEVYLWGYNAQYPVVKVVGSDYATVTAKVANLQVQINAVTATANNDAGVRSLLGGLRTAFAGDKTVQVFTYTYKPLIGITSETDPSGRTTYYEYDSFGRLSKAKDDQGNIIKHICYNYAGQVTNCNQ